MSLPASAYCLSCHQVCGDSVILPCCSGSVCESCAKFKLAKQKVCFLCQYSSHVLDNASSRINVDSANNNEEDVIEENFDNFVKHDKSFYCRVLSSTDCGQSKSLQIKAYVQGFSTQTEESRVEGGHASESFIKIDDFEIDADKSFLGDNALPIEHVKSVLTKEGVGNKTVTVQWSHEVAQNMASLVLCKSLDRIIKSLKRKYQNNLEGTRVLDNANKPKLPTKIVDIASKKKDSFASALMENAKKRQKSTNADIVGTKRTSKSPENLPFAPALVMKNEDDVRLDTLKQRKSFGNSPDDLQCFNISERSYSISDFGRDKSYSISDCNSGAKLNQPGDVGNDVKDHSEERERSNEMTDGNDVNGHSKGGQRTVQMTGGNEVKGHSEEGEQSAEMTDGNAVQGHREERGDRNDVKDHSVEGERSVELKDGNDVKGHSEEGQRTVLMIDGNDVNGHSEEEQRAILMTKWNDVKGHSEEGQRIILMRDGNDVKGHSEEGQRTVQVTGGNDVKGHSEEGVQSAEMTGGNAVQGHREERGDINDVKDYSVEGERTVELKDGNNVKGHSEEGHRTVLMTDGNDVKGHSEEVQRTEGIDVKGHLEEERTVKRENWNAVKGHSEDWERAVEMTDVNASYELPLNFLQTNKAGVDPIHFQAKESSKVESKVNTITFLKTTVNNDTKSIVGGLVQKMDDFENLSTITEGDLDDTSSNEKWPSLEAELISSPDAFASTSNQVQDYVSSKCLLGIVALQTEVIASSENFTNSESLSECLSSISSVENFSGC